MRACSVLLLLLLTATGLASSPAEAVGAAYTDLQRLDPSHRPGVRYLSLYALGGPSLADDVKVLAFHLNTLSRRARLRPLPARDRHDLTQLLNRPDGTPLLIRVCLEDLGWDPAVYERLAQVEPYFHATEAVAEEKEVQRKETVPWPGGVWPADGKEYAKGSFTYERVTTDKVLVPTTRRALGNAPWLPTREIAWLTEQMKTQVPVVRADWLFVQTAVSRARAAGYYDFMGFKSRQDFFDLVGFKLAEAQKREREVAAIFQDSGVSINNRQVYRFGSLDSGYWQTRDVFDDQTKARNAVDALNGKYRHDAEEHYGSLSNGLFAYFLSDAQGGLQTAAPPEVGFDRTTTSNDGRIHAPLSCIRCHVEGLRPLDDYGRQLWQGERKLAAFDPKRFRRLEQLYLAPLKEELEDDVRRYARALTRLNGPAWTPLKNATAYKDAWRRWNDEKVTLSRAAAELGGLNPDLLKARLQRYARPVNMNAKGEPVKPGEEPGLGQLVPNSLAAFMLDDDSPMLRDHFAEHFGLMQKAYRGITEPLREAKPDPPDAAKGKEEAKP